MRFNLRRLDNLGQIVNFVLGAPEEVLRALVRVCELFYNNQWQFRLTRRLVKSPVVRRWRGLKFRKLGLLCAAEQNNNNGSDIAHRSPGTCMQ